MTEGQKSLLGNDCNFALLPYLFHEAMQRHCNYDYAKNEKIDDVLSVRIGALGKFWKFVEGTQYLSVTNDPVIVRQEKGQQDGCIVPLLRGVEKVTAVFADGMQDEYPLDISVFKGVSVGAIDFTFENPIQKLVLHFNYTVAPPLEVEFVTELFQEPATDYRKEYLDRMRITHACGQDLVNIKFDLAADNVTRTEIVLYENERGARRLMMTYPVAKGTFFASIGGLAYGTYSYIVKQYTEDSVLLVESDVTDFTLNAPQVGGKNIVWRK